MDVTLPAWPVLVVATAAFVAGGFVKGLVSIGLPLAALPLLTLVVDVRTSVMLVLIPILASNIIQAFEGGAVTALLHRFRRVIASLIIGAMIGSAILASLDQRTLLLLLGGFTALAAVGSLLNPKLAITPRQESWLSAPVGLAAGVIGGMSTLYGPLLALYLLGLNLPRDAFVKCMALFYLVGSVFLLIGGLLQGAAGAPVVIASVGGVVPVYLGMVIGRRLRERTDPRIFRILVLGLILLTSANMIRQGLGH